MGRAAKRVFETAVHDALALDCLASTQGRAFNEPRVASTSVEGIEGKEPRYAAANDHRIEMKWCVTH